MCKYFNDITEVPEFYINDIQEIKNDLEFQKYIEVLTKRSEKSLKKTPYVPFRKKIYFLIMETSKLADEINKIDVNKLNKGGVETMYDKCIVYKPTPIIRTITIYILIIVCIVALIIEKVIPLISGLIIGGLIISFLFTAFHDLNQWRKKHC